MKNRSAINYIRVLKRTNAIAIFKYISRVTRYVRK